MEKKYFKWDSNKNKKLIKDRGISFDEIIQGIENNASHLIMQNPSREGQFLLAIFIKGYCWAVPFVVEDDDIMVLKTAYKSRKLRRLFDEKGSL
jgi:uncharacterized DUF497 family protein